MGLVSLLVWVIGSERKAGEGGTEGVGAAFQSPEEVGVMGLRGGGEGAVGEDYLLFGLLDG